MSFYEYELKLINGNLKLHKAKKHNKDIKSIDDAMCFLLDYYDIPRLAIEKAFVLSYDMNGNFNGFMQIGTGDFKEVQIPLSTAFKFLLLKNAVGCIFVHNHVEGSDLVPSNGDYTMHTMVTTTCTALNIELFANIILQNDYEYYDIKTNKLEEIE